MSIDEIERDFRRRMRDARQAKGMSQRQFSEHFSAAYSDLDKSAVSRIETGLRHVSLAEAVWIAEFLCIPVFDKEVEAMSGLEKFVDPYNPPADQAATASRTTFYPCDRGLPDGSVRGWHNFQASGEHVVCSLCGKRAES